MSTNFCTMSEMALLRLYELAFKYRDEAMITMVSNELVTRLQPETKPQTKDTTYAV